MEMVGQMRNKSQIKTWKEENNLPRTLILSGSRGSGKRTLASYISEQFGFDVRWVGNKVNDVRDMISDCRSLSKPTMFVFVGADDMSLSAKNSLLKVTEEPPNDAYFVIPLEDVSSTLATIKSRSIEMQMEPYTKEQLRLFLYGEFPSDKLRLEIFRGNIPSDELCLEIANNPGELIELERLGVDNLVEIVEKVIDNIFDVGCGNALSIAKHIKFKDEDEGYDLGVFWRVLNNRLVYRLYDNILKFSMAQVKEYTDFMLVTQEFLNRLNNPSYNRKMLFDMWVLALRKEV